jgi:hypothetical protein
MHEHQAIAISSLPDVRKRMEIDNRYRHTVAAWQEQCDLAIRLARAEFKMKCHLAKALRDADLREIDRDANAR